MATTPNPTERIKMLYFTDPVCSHCWALEGTMNRFKHEYAAVLDVVTVMGGMFDDPLSKSEADDMAEHWTEVGLYYNIPIDGRIWKTTGVATTWPASIAFLVLDGKDPVRAARFLRIVREAVFLERRDIGDRAVLADLLRKVGADADAVVEFAYSPQGRDLLLANMKPMVELGIEGYPAVVFMNDAGEAVKVVGARSFETYRKAMLKMMKSGTEPSSAGAEPLSALVERIPTLFDNEVEKIYDVRKDAFSAFVAASLPAGTYELGETLGHRFVRHVGRTTPYGNPV
ncbi:MAG: DsbA family protein [Candidatus Izemoplasmatales bacterium]